MGSEYRDYDTRNYDVKPCPLCGNGMIDKWVDGVDNVYIGCSICQFQIGGNLIPQLNHAQQSDTLTQLWNRRYKEDKLKQETEKSGTLKESYKTFCEIYKITTGEDYED